MRAWIRKRPTKHGASFQVLYRRGGRAYRIECGGSFPTRRDADRRCDAVQAGLRQGSTRWPNWPGWRTRRSR